jgi:hypothetical protein
VLAVAEEIPGKLEAFQTYNDAWRGWPVTPLAKQHPIRGGFLDPRPDPTLGAIYHEGVDVAVRDDRPERGAPRGRTHRVYAIEGGQVVSAPAPGTQGAVRIGHFGYGHVDPVVRPGQTIQPAQHIGWTVYGNWHVHLTEWIFTAGGGRVLVNPLRRGGKLHPYVNRAKPDIREIRYYEPATPKWARRPGTTVAKLPQAGRRLDKSRLSGKVDVRVRLAEPQSFIGWFKELPWLAAPHHPFRVAVTVVQVATGEAVVGRDVFWSEQKLDVPTGQHFAPGTEQNLPASACMTFHRTVPCDGTYWFRLFPRPYWDTTRHPDGRYRLRVRAWNIVGETAEAETVVTIANRV